MQPEADTLSDYYQARKHVVFLARRKNGQGPELSETLEIEGKILKWWEQESVWSPNVMFMLLQKDTWFILMYTCEIQSKKHRVQYEINRVTTYKSKFDTIWRNKTELRFSKIIEFIIWYNMEFISKEQENMTQSQKQIEIQPIHDPDVGNSIQIFKWIFITVLNKEKCTHNEWKGKIQWKF